MQSPWIVIEPAGKVHIWCHDEASATDVAKRRAHENPGCEFHVAKITGAARAKVADPVFTPSSVSEQPIDPPDIHKNSQRSQITRCENL